MNPKEEKTVTVARETAMEVRGIRRSFRSGKESIEVLRHVDLDVHDADSVAVVGPSGSGKSTLLNIMGTLDRPDSGSVLLDGENLLAAEESRLAEIRRTKIGFVFQQHHLLPQCTVLENVLIPTLMQKKKKQKENESRALVLLRRVGLADRLTHRPGLLSGGERQRVAVVRALINQPRVLLADEPTGSLDRESSERLSDLLLQLNREQSVALVVVTHSVSLAAKMKRWFELRDGQLTTPAEARDR